MPTCTLCYREHRLTSLCDEDPKQLASDFVMRMATLQERAPNPVEAWILAFADARPEHLTDEECLWFEVLVRLNQVAEDAQEAFDAKEVVPPSVVATGHHVGEVGKRCTMTVTVGDVVDLGVHEKYGQRFLVPMRTKCNAEVVWFTGENLTLEDNKTYTITARVEDHGVYQGRNQTRISRAKEVKADG